MTFAPSPSYQRTWSIGRGVGPDSGAREPVNPLGPPVEVDAERFDGSLRLSLGHATCCRGPGRTRNEDHEQQAAGCFHGRVFRFIGEVGCWIISKRPSHHGISP